MSQPPSEWSGSDPDGVSAQVEDGPLPDDDSIAAAVAAAAGVEAELALQAIIDTQAACAAALTVAEAAATAALALTDAVETKAVVVAAAAEAAATARRTEARLNHEILHDGLTGLANKRLLVDRLTQALARSKRAGTSVAVLYLDLDRFKDVNDRHGHATGDQLLIGVARRLEQSLRASDTCARVGGDEFVVLCEDVSEPSAGSSVAGRLESALRAGIQVGDLTVPVHASVGVAISSPGCGPAELLNDADTAMYRVKSSARTRAKSMITNAAEQH